MYNVVALSGGKDSTAMAVRLAEVEPRDYIRVITPTGDEPPEMIAHWRKLSKMLGPLKIATCGDSLDSLIKKQTALPNHQARWCTRLLKLEPYYSWLAQHTPCISYVGLRADEESRPGMIFPDADDVTMDFPMRRWGWTLEDVQGFLAERGIEMPPRTDCNKCFWQTLGEWYLLWRDNPTAYWEAAELEEWVSGERGVTYTFRNPFRDDWPAALRDLAAWFEKGRIPERSLKQLNSKRQIGACRVCTL